MGDRYSAYYNPLFVDEETEAWTLYNMPKLMQLVSGKVGI